MTLTLDRQSRDRTQIFSGLDLVPGRMGDSRLLVSLFEHWYQVFLGKAIWHSPIMMFPEQHHLGFTDMVLVHGLAYVPFRSIGFDVFASSVLSLMVMTATAYLAFGFMVRRLFGVSWIASAICSWFFAFSSVKFLNMGHYQLHAYFMLPFLLYAATRFLVSLRRRALKTLSDILGASVDHAWTRRQLTALNYGTSPNC